MIGAYVRVCELLHLLDEAIKPCASYLSAMFRLDARLSHRSSAVVKENNVYSSSGKCHLVRDERVLAHSLRVKSSSRIFESVDVSHFVNVEIAFRFSNPRGVLFWSVSRVGII
jgi:hypothetical protein